MMGEKSVVVRLEVIDTPRGPVPSAKCLEELIRALNVILDRIFSTIKRTNELVDESIRVMDGLASLLRTMNAKLDVIQSSISEIKILVEEAIHPAAGHREAITIDEVKKDMLKLLSGDPSDEHN